MTECGESEFSDFKIIKAILWLSVCGYGHCFWKVKLIQVYMTTALGVGDGQGTLACCMQSMGSQRVGQD